MLTQGEWDGYQRPDWLDPRDPQFARIAESFYRHQADLYGRTAAYKMDLMHEGGNSDGVPMGEAAVAVMTALQTARPGATWVMLGWEGNPRRDVLDALRACKPKTACSAPGRTWTSSQQHRAAPPCATTARPSNRRSSLLLQADPSLRAVDAYRYDVVDFVRQALANHARVLLPKIKAAYAARDLSTCAASPADG